MIVTGGCGFIGSHFVRLALSKGAWVTNVDALTYAGIKENLSDCEDHPHYRFSHTDIRQMDDLKNVFEKQENVDVLVHFAAESHVDRSLTQPSDFVSTNVLGTANLLCLSKWKGVKRFVHVSTDEVYGSLAEGEPSFDEQSPLLPNNPYSASKASADLLLLANIKSFRFPGIIVRCSNNFGPFQFPEKLIPRMLCKCMLGEGLPVYGNGKNMRDWIYVEDQCRGIWSAIEHGRLGQIYNFGGNMEKRNIEVVEALKAFFPETCSKMEFVTDRPGHDWRYSMSSEKARKELDWKPSISFERGLEMTVDWYVNNSDWWRKHFPG